MEVLIDLVHELFSDEIVFFLLNVPSAVGSDGEILGHVTLFDSFDGDIFEEVSELGEEFVVVKLSSVSKTSGPSEDGGNGVGGCSFTLLPLSVMSGDGTVSSFSLNNTLFVEED